MKLFCDWDCQLLSGSTYHPLQIIVHVTSYPRYMCYGSPENWLDFSHFWVLTLTCIWVFFGIFTVRCSYASVVLAVVIPLSICLSHACFVTKTKQFTADILIPHKRAITLVFWHQQWLVGDTSCHVKFALKVTRPLQNMQTLTDFHSWLLNHKR